MTDLFPDSYFYDRNLTDHKRLSSFMNEKNLIKFYSNSLNGKVCDVGCSTGEFLEAINWQGDRYGMEINSYAKSMAINKNISFDKNILNKSNFFDAVIFRGTIQHVTEPFLYIQRAYDSLVKGGHLYILATPNIDSIYYRLFNELPALEKSKSYYLPSASHTLDLCERLGFTTMNLSYPYKYSGYANPKYDYLKFFIRLLSKNKKYKAPFPGNMFNYVCQKN